MDVILFLIFAAIAVVCGFNVVVQSHPIASAISLIGVMGSLAVLYLLLGAEFLAAAQVIVYAGAIMVLFVFVIMLLNAGAEIRKGRALLAQVLGIPLLFTFLGLMAYFARNMFPARHGCGRRARAVHPVFAALRSGFGADPDRHSGRGGSGAKGDGVTCPPACRFPGT